MFDSKRRRFVARQLVVTLVLAAVATVSASSAGAWELIPSLGITKSTDSDAGDAQGFAGLAIRAPLFSFLKAEGGIGYRQDSFSDGDLKVRQWPVTASLWAAPFPNLYLGGGVGWYYSTLDYDSGLAIEDDTSSEMGVHLGGGATLPISPQLGLDLNGRYIFMQGEDTNLQVPTEFDPGFWNVSLGLAFKF